MKTDKTNYGFLAKVILMVILVWGLSAVVISYVFNNWADGGTFGDSFGVVNSLFSGLAFAGLLYTIILQRQDLRLQRKEIIQNREQLKKSVFAQQKSEQALEEQVTQMKITAKLNALQTIMEYYNIQISNPSNSDELIQKAKVKRRATIQEIDALIDRIDDDDLE